MSELNFIQVEEDSDELKQIVDDIMSIVNLYPDIFPHLYKQDFKMEGRVLKGDVVYQDGVFITFTEYSNTRRLSKNAFTRIKEGDVIIHQFGNKEPGNGKTREVLDLFMDHFRKKGAHTVFLTVRKENERACRFYEKYGFTFDSDIHWNSKETGKIEGSVYRYELKEYKKLKQFFNVD